MGRSVSSRHLLVSLVGLAGAILLASPGCSCGSDTETPKSSTGTTTASGSGGAGGQGGDGGQAGAGGDGGAGGAGGGQGGGGGTVASHGPPATETVSAGQVSKNGSYTMVFTFGQPTQNQGTSTSPGHRLQGGLVGANGSLP